MRVVLAGASGTVGRRVGRLLEAQGVELRAVSGLDLTREDAAGLAEGCSAAISCAGASVRLSNQERRGYRTVDVGIHTALLKEIQRAGIKRFVYLGVYTEESYCQTAYVEAHEEVARMLRRSALDFTIVRPTGIYSAFEELQALARWGVSPLIGKGLARTNPIDPQDVAELIVENLWRGPAELPCGGPEVLTRREIQELVCGTGKWMPAVPPSLVRWQGKLIGLWNERLRDLMEFFAAVSEHDAIAPALGKRRLRDYFAARLA